MSKGLGLVYTYRINEAPKPDKPHRVVQCHCKQDCYVGEDTLAMVKSDGYDPDYICRHCAPPGIAEEADMINAVRSLLGIPSGAGIEVVTEIEAPQEGGGTLH